MRGSFRENITNNDCRAVFVPFCGMFVPKDTAVQCCNCLRHNRISWFLYLLERYKLSAWAVLVPRTHSWASSAMNQWIDTRLSVMLTTNSIDPLVKDFFLYINSIDNWNNSLLNQWPFIIGSHSTDSIDPLIKTQKI
jgi:hypothetical protein